jgi:NADPH2:quinone reductase
MRAIGYRKPSPALDALEVFDLPLPVPEGRDLLIEVRAVSVNPVDYKTANQSAPSPGGVRVLGYDAAGVVAQTGSGATLFGPGDEVFYARSIGQQGSNAEYQLVDERIVGRKPRSLHFPAAAALPLTAITA